MSFYQKILPCVLLFISSSVTVYGYDPLLVVVIMVKNEETVICETLKPFAENSIPCFVFDTGSNDKTMEIAHEYLDKNNTRYAIMQEPFIDFPTSRNRALTLAEEKFPNAAFFLMIDAEWYIHNVQGLIDFCKNHCDDPTPTYAIRLIWPGNDSPTYRLSKVQAHARFFGDPHEVLLPESGIEVPRTTYCEYRPARQGYEKSKRRWLIDKEKFLKKFAENPFDTRTSFYLAQTYECLNELHDAYKMYLFRSHLTGAPEENYETFYRLGRVTNLLSQGDSNFTWDMAFDYYATAFKMRPHRAEPLIAIAEHYWPDNIPLCFLFAKRALDLPYPEHELLFVNNQIYNYHRYEVISKSAWTVGEYELGEYATKKALEIYPEMPHLLKNLEVYKQKNAKV